jgi:hypothetical protein
LLANFAFRCLAVAVASVAFPWPVAPVAPVASTSCVALRGPSGNIGLSGLSVPPVASVAAVASQVFCGSVAAAALGL